MVTRADVVKWNRLRALPDVSVIDLVEYLARQRVRVSVNFVAPNNLGVTLVTGEGATVGDAITNALADYERQKRGHASVAAVLEDQT